jgi:hypothetical protein
MLTLILCVITNNFCFSQVIEDMELDEKAISNWIVHNKNAYEGLYFFGISEAESQVFVAIEDSIICVQVLNYTWTAIDNERSDWRPQYTNYHNVKITGNKFFSTETNGEFVIYSKANEKIYGLKLLDPPNGQPGQYEVGTQGNKDKLEYMNGKYSFTKFDIVSQEELNKLSLQELKIMRNEIYARYGYLFTSKGEMDLYFRKQDWYVSLNDNVDNYLTEIEKENIKRIKLAEK